MAFLTQNPQATLNCDLRKNREGDRVAQERRQHGSQHVAAHDPGEHGRQQEMQTKKRRKTYERASGNAPADLMRRVRQATNTVHHVTGRTAPAAARVDPLGDNLGITAFAAALEQGGSFVGSLVSGHFSGSSVQVTMTFNHGHITLCLQRQSDRMQMFDIP